MEFALYLATAFTFTLIPGPNALLIVSTTLKSGTKRGLQVSLGISLGVAVQLIIAILSTGWLLAKVTAQLEKLKWMGLCLAAFLVVKFLIRRLWRSRPIGTSGKATFGKGLALSLANPKGIIFFCILLPQFIHSNTLYTPTHQLYFLSATFALVVTFCDIGYVIFAHQCNTLLRGSWFQRLRRNTVKAKD